MDRDMDTLPLSNPPPCSTTIPKSDNTYLVDDDDHQGETRQKAHIYNIMIHYLTQPMITTFMTGT
jgi:hypothetical protein